MSKCKVLTLPVVEPPDGVEDAIAWLDKHFAADKDQWQVLWVYIAAGSPPDLGAAITTLDLPAGAAIEWLDDRFTSQEQWVFLLALIQAYRIKQEYMPALSLAVEGAKRKYAEPASSKAATVVH